MSEQFGVKYEDQVLGKIETPLAQHIMKRIRVVSEYIKTNGVNVIEKYYQERVAYKGLDKLYYKQSDEKSVVRLEKCLLCGKDMHYCISHILSMHF